MALTHDGTQRDWDEEDAVEKALGNVTSVFEDLKVHVEELLTQHREMKKSLRSISPPGVVPAFEGILPVPEGSPQPLQPPKTADASSRSKPEVPSRSLQVPNNLQILDPDHPAWDESKHGLSLAAARLGMLVEKEEDQRVTKGKSEHEKRKSRKSMSSLFEAETLYPGEQDNVFLRTTKKPVFKIIALTMIVLNAAYLGWDTDRQVKNSFKRYQGIATEKVSVIPDVVFSVWFLIELILRFAAERNTFFTGRERYWNILDFSLVLSKGIEITLRATQVHNVSYLRIIHVLRLSRLVRVIKAVRALRVLRTMIFAILNSFQSLMWAFAMTCLVVFVFAIAFCDGAATYYDSLDSFDGVHKKLTDADVFFGSLSKSMISLFAAITGGNDWMTYGEVLMSMSFYYFLMFIFYIAFCVIGLLNVVTGIFVDHAVTTRTEDEVIESFVDEKRRRSEEIRKIFYHAVEDVNGALTYSQFKQLLEEPSVKAYFSGLDIDPQEAAILFTLLDTDSNRCVDVDEFINGTLKLSGSAKSTDLLLLMFDNVRFSMKFNLLCSFIEEELDFIRKVVAPGTASGRRIFNYADQRVTEEQAGLTEAEGEARPSLPALS